MVSIELFDEIVVNLQLPDEIKYYSTGITAGLSKEINRMTLKVGEKWINVFFGSQIICDRFDIKSNVLSKFFDWSDPKLFEKLREHILQALKYIEE